MALEFVKQSAGVLTSMYAQAFGREHRRCPNVLKFVHVLQQIRYDQVCTAGTGQHGVTHECVY